MGLFGALVFQIIAQQISVIAATAIFVRITEHFGGRVPDAGELAAVDQGTLRGLGLSRRKAATVLDLAQRFSDGRLSEAELRELPDQEVIRRLTEVKGVGAWTVQGALLIASQRPDVIRPDDLALRHAIRARYGLDHLPDPDSHDASYSPPGDNQLRRRHGAAGARKKAVGGISAWRLASVKV